MRGERKREEKQFWFPLRTQEAGKSLMSLLPYWSLLESCATIWRTASRFIRDYSISASNSELAQSHFGGEKW